VTRAHSITPYPPHCLSPSRQWWARNHRPWNSHLFPALSYLLSCTCQQQQRSPLSAALWPPLHSLSCCAGRAYFSRGLTQTQRNETTQWWAHTEPWLAAAWRVVSKGWAHPSPPRSSWVQPKPCPIHLRMHNEISWICSPNPGSRRWNLWGRVVDDYSQDARGPGCSHLPLSTGAGVPAPVWLSAGGTGDTVACWDLDCFAHLFFSLYHHRVHGMGVASEREERQR
jgi:hypothetical protein